MAKVKTGIIGLLAEEYKKDFWGTAEKLASIGYSGIEGVPAPLLEGDIKANLERLKSIGLEIIAVSAKREDVKDDLDSVLKKAKDFNAKQVSVFWGPCDSRDELLVDAELYNSAGARLAEEGIKLCYHNHEHEFKTTFNGVYALDILAEHTEASNLYFEIDIAWTTFGGEDPAKVIRRLGGRVAALHIKDLYDLNEKGMFTAVGTGVVPVKEAVQAGIDVGVKWIIIEQDKLRNLSALETATVSYLNLKEAGLI